MKDNEDAEELFIERRIVTGAIVSTEYLKDIAQSFLPELLQSTTARILVQWCLEHFKQYAKAPNKDIEGIFTNKLKQLKTDQAGDIASILDSLSDEFERGKFNVDYLRDETRKYFTDRRLRLTIAKVQAELDAGRATEAERLLNAYEPVKAEKSHVSDPFSPEAVSEAFQSATEPLIHFGRALGKIWDKQFTRDSFVALLGPEKGYKSSWLLEIAIRGMMEGNNIAFFQAGDMSEKQQNRRIYIRVAGKSDMEEYCGELYIPVTDCVRHQQDTCNKCDNRGGSDFEVDLNDPNFDKLRSAFMDNREYQPCRNKNCTRRIPTVWFTVRQEVEPLTEREARKVTHRFQRRFKKQFKLATYANETLTMAEIKSQLLSWEKYENFVPDLVCIAEGSLVLTDNGLKPIETVTLDDKVWDGENWVSHAGVIYKGEKDVIEYCGLTATPGHLVWTEDGWRTIESCAQMGLQIAQTGIGKQNIRIGKNYISCCSNTTSRLQKVWSNIQTQRKICSNRMSKMQKKKMDFYRKSKTRTSKRMSNVLTTKDCFRQKIILQTTRCKTAVYKSTIRCMERLWRTWNKILFSIYKIRIYLGAQKLRSFKTRNGIRQDKQRWELRTGKSEMVNTPTKYATHAEESNNNSLVQIPTTISSCKIRRRYDKEVYEKNVNSGNSASMEYKKKGRVRVWDIINAGPFHCFTVQGLLVHNCVDYLDICAPDSDTMRLDKRHQEDRKWQRARRLSEEMHCCFVTATQADTESYGQTVLGMKNFSETKTKNAHATYIAGLNQTDEEKKMGIMRINTVVAREADFNAKSVVYVCQRLQMGRVFLTSF